MNLLKRLELRPAHAYRRLYRCWWQKIGTGPWEYRVVVQRPRLFHKHVRGSR